MKSNNHISNSTQFFTPIKLIPRNFAIFFFIFLIGFISSCACSGQNVDSLKSLLTKEFGPKRQHILFDLAYYYTDVDNHLATNYINEATLLSATYADSMMIVKCGRLKSLLYRRFDQMDSSLTLSHAILSIAERNKFDSEIRRILNGLALVYAYKAIYDKSLYYYLRILELSDPEKNRSEVSTALNNVGLVYLKLYDYDKALYYFKQSLSFKDKTNSQPDYETTLMNIGLCYAYKHDYSLAKSFTDSAFNFCKDSCSKGFVGPIYFNYGFISYGLKKFSAAEKHFLRSYSLAKEAGDERFQLDNLVQLFQLYLDTRNINAAKRLIGDAESILMTDTFYSEGVIQLYDVLIKLYEQLGDLRQLAYYQSKYIRLKDNVFNEQLTKNLMKVEAEYLERENKAKIEAQDQVLTLSNDIINRQRILNIIVGIVAILSVGFVFLLVEMVRQKKRANVLLEKKIFERTVELENQHNLLQKSLHEREIQVERMATEIRSSLATIKGLGLLVLQDVNMLDTSHMLTRLAKPQIISFKDYT